MGRKELLEPESSESDEEDPQDATSERWGESGKRQSAKWDDPDDEDIPSKPATKHIAFVKKAPISVAANSIKQNKQYSKVPQEFGQFEKFTKGIGSKLMMKMGYKLGQGLGLDGSGRAAPIDVKLRPKGMGIGHGGFNERIDPAREPIAISSIEIKPVNEGWKKGKKRVSAPKRIYKTVKELSMDQEKSKLQPNHMKITDLTGKEPRVTDLKDIHQANDGPLAELIHNVQLVSDIAKSKLEDVAKNNHASSQRMSQEVNNKSHLKIYMETESIRLNGIQNLLNILQECKELSKQESVRLNNPTADTIDDVYGLQLDTIVTKHLVQFKSMALEPVIVALFAPVLKSLYMQWNVQREPLLGLELLRDRRRLLLSNIQSDSEMPEFDAMMFNIWIPKLRQFISNQWDVYEPDSIISLIRQWFSTKKSIQLLPSWMYQNVVNQLIIPKLKSAVEIWTFAELPIHSWLFPWFPVIGDEITELWTSVRRKLETVFALFDPSEPVCYHTVSPLKEVFCENDLIILITKCILPRLVLHLRTKFQINPANQQISSLIDVFTWKLFIPTSIFSHLLKTEFFNKWQSALWAWITSPNVRLDEVSKWYTIWKELFSSHDLADMESVKEGFRTGLDMMNQGLSATTKSFQPVFIKSQSQGVARIQATVQMTFLDLVEQCASESNLEFLPMNRNHEDSGKPLFRLGKVRVYIDSGVIFVAVSKGVFEPKSVADAAPAALLRPSNRKSVVQVRSSSHGTHENDDHAAKKPFHTEEQIKIAREWPAESYATNNHAPSKFDEPFPPPFKIEKASEENSFNSRMAVWLGAVVIALGLYRLDEHFAIELRPLKKQFGEALNSMYGIGRDSAEYQLASLADRRKSAEERMILSIAARTPSKERSYHAFPGMFERASDNIIEIGSQMDISDIKFKHSWEQFDELDLSVPK